jgi:S1-C subfamily serine protease
MLNKKIKNIENDVTVVRFSVWWMAFFILATLGIGIAGGIAGQQMFQASLPPLIENEQGITTVTQTVTISPNKATEDLITTAERSIFLINQADKPIAMAPMITSDGLIVTAAGVRGSLTAYDNEGREVTVEYVGEDSLFGLTYLRLPKTVVSPLDLRANDVPVGHTLVAMSRDEETFTSQIEMVTANEYQLPKSGQPAGVQRILESQVDLQELWLGAPLLDEEGKIAGLWLGDQTILPVNLLRASLERFSANNREKDVLKDLGLSVSYEFKRAPEDQIVTFGAQLIAVKPNSPAARANLKIGDTIIAINDQPLVWTESFITSIPENLFTVDYTRENRLETTTIQFAD